MHRILVARDANAPIATVDDAELPALLSSPAARIWVDITSPVEEGDVALVRDVFGFHALAIEDCFEDREQPKVDEFPDHLYIITHGLTAESDAEEAATVELDAFVSARYLVTHHARPSRSVSAVWDSVLRTGLLLRRSPMTLLHAILDRQADGLEAVLDQIGDSVSNLEDAVFERPSNEQLATLLAVKRNILHLRRWMAKQREVVMRLGRREFPLVAEGEGHLFRDVYDHLSRYTETLDNYREMLSSIQDAYLSIVSNRLNEVMKFLTLFTTVLMPLSLISGIYGMNFVHMPELTWSYGYPMVLVLMVTVVGGLLLYFRHRGWLGGRSAGGGDDKPPSPSPSPPSITVPPVPKLGGPPKIPKS